MDKYDNLIKITELNDFTGQVFLKLSLKYGYLHKSLYNLLDRAAGEIEELINMNIPQCTDKFPLPQTVAQGINKPKGARK